MELWTIALRNVFRNPRRTALNILAVAIGVAVILSMKGWIGGFAQTAYETQMDLDTAQVQVLNQGYQDERQRLPLDLLVTDWKAVQKALVGQPGVTAVGARLDFSAQITNGTTGIQVMVRGVDPDAEAQLTTLKANVKDGTWFADENRVLIGSGLARKLGLKVGDQVFLTALDQYGVRNLVDAQVGGIFSLGYGLFDDSLVLTTLSKAQETLALAPGTATRVVVRFADKVNTAVETRLVDRILRDSGLVEGQSLKVYEWKEFAQAVVSTIDTRIRLLSFMMAILVVLVVVGILNSMSMAVQERFREIGTLRAIGMNRRTLVQLFLAEGFTLGLMGGLAGAAVAGVGAILGTLYGLDISGVLPKDIPIPFTSVLRPLYTLTDFPLAVFGAALIAVAGSLVPARRAGQMVIRDTLGSHV
jgi:putative ABC transport system permease protein